MKGGCSFPMGPLELLDLVGLDTSMAILDALHASSTTRATSPAPLLRALVSKGQPRPQVGAGLLRLPPVAAEHARGTEARVRGRVPRTA